MNLHRTLLALTSAMLLTSSIGYSQSDRNGVQSFSGEIMDDICARDKTHSNMMEEMKSMGHDPIVCSRKCAELGAKYVLYDRERDTVYALAEQDKAEAFAGHKVHILGTVDKKKIKIEKIEAADSQHQKDK